MKSYLIALFLFLNFLCPNFNCEVNSNLDFESRLRTLPEPCNHNEDNSTSQQIVHGTTKRNDTSDDEEIPSAKYYDELGEELSDDELKLVEELYPLDASDFVNDDVIEEIEDPEHENATSLNHSLSRVKRGYVTMPTGKRFRIPSPKPKKKEDWDCRKNKSKKIQIKRSWKEYSIIKHEMEKTIRHHPGYSFTHYNIIKIEKIINGCLWKQYLHRQKEILAERAKVNQRMLWHGSKSIDDIALHGFNEQYANIHGMFGAGLYFAKHSSKSNQYVFNTAKASECPVHKDMNCKICERKQLLCRVALGKTKYVYTMKRFYHAPAGYHSVTALPSKQPKGLKYPEYIVYRREQAYPEYLITYKLA